MPINNRVLDNGIRLVTEPIATTEAVAIGFWFNRGSRDEIDGEYGITHFIEHMVFKGTPELSAYDIARFFDRIGGYFNAFTEREMLCIHCLVPSTHTIDAIDIIAKLLYASVFKDEDIEKERSVITSEILSSLDDPDEMGMDIALDAMYPAHSFSRPVAGSVADVVSLSPDAIRSRKNLILSSVRPLVAVAGNFDEASIAHRLEKIKISGNAIDADISNPPRWHSGMALPVSRFAQSQIFLSYPLYGFSSSSVWHSLAMANAMIGDTVSSRLFQSLREEKGLCYSVGSFYICNRDSAFWMASVAVPPEKTTEAVASLISEIHNIRSSGFTPREFDDAREHLCGELILSAEDTENRMKRLARQWFYNGILLTIPESVSLIENIKPDSVRSIIENSLTDAERSLVIYATKKQTKEIRKKWKYDIR